MDKSLEQLFFAVLGGALAVKDKIEASNEEFKAWQEKSEENARQVYSDLVQKGEQEKDQLKQMLKECFKDAIDELDLATKEDLEKLKKDLETG